MIYTPIRDFISCRIQQETKARERVRGQATTAFFTVYLDPADISPALKYRNIKIWLNNGHLTRLQIKTLWEKGILTEDEYRKIARIIRTTIPEDDYMSVDIDTGVASPVVGEISLPLDGSVVP